VHMLGSHIGLARYLAIRRRIGPGHEGLWI
jgi:hypothetical protein